MRADRVFEYTDKALSAQFQPDGRIDIAKVAEVPALFVEETKGSQGPQFARVGNVLRARKTGGEVTLDYVYDASIPPVSNAALEDLSAQLGIDDFEFSRTHWAIKDADLFRALLGKLQPRRLRPRVFTLYDPEKVEPGLASAMMPFAKVFDEVFAALKEAAKEAGLRCRRADDIWENPAVIQDVVSLIDRSRVVICDCSGRNPNVFYETGIAHTLGREVILITQSSEDIPFDLRQLAVRDLPKQRRGPCRTGENAVTQAC